MTPFSGNLRQRGKSLTERVSEYQEQIQRLGAEQDALQQEMDQEIKLLQQDASEREKSFQGVGRPEIQTP